MSAFEKKFGKDFLSTIPTTPGVYFFYCAEGKLLYVGKAKSLRKRLAQYRDAKKTRRHKKMRYLIENASRLEWEICESDLEASLKEARLIQKLRPPKNIAGAYSFLYPLVGIRSDEKCLYFCLTTLPEKFPNYTFHGCFRSRKVTGGAFFALMEILEYVGHPLSAKDLKSEGRAEYSYVFGFRQIESRRHQPAPGFHLKLGLKKRAATVATNDRARHPRNRSPEGVRLRHSTGDGRSDRGG